MGTSISIPRKEKSGWHKVKPSGNTGYWHGKKEKSNKRGNGPKPLSKKGTLFEKQFLAGRDPPRGWTTGGEDPS